MKLFKYQHLTLEMLMQGEVKESDGAGNGKQEFMLEYKNLYSRRRAFHEELRRYGMKR